MAEWNFVFRTIIDIEKANWDIPMKIIILLIIVCALFIAEPGATEITNCWGGVWLPFWEKGADSIPAGFDIDILAATCKEANITLKHTDYEVPWKRTIHSIKTGDLDITTAASITPEREVFAYFVGPYRHESVALYVRKGESARYSIKSIYDLLTIPEVAIGTEAGSTYGDEIDSVLSLMGSRVKRIVDKDFSARKMLKAGHTDMYLGYPTEEKLYVDSLIEQHPMPVVQLEGVYFMVSRKSCSQTTVDLLEKALLQITKNGVYDSIKTFYTEKYDLQDW